MAGVRRVGPLAGADIDALFYALRPRIVGLLNGGAGGSAPGPQGPAGPKGVNWKGEWAADEDYELGDLVYLDTTGGGLAELVTYYCLTDHTSIAGSPPVPGGNTQWWELGNAYLLLDGSRPMTGDLDMDDHQVADVKNLTMAGATLGEAEVSNVRQLHLIGDDDDGEARVDGAERVVFNNEPTKSVIENPSRLDMNTSVAAGSSYTATEGRVSWDSLEDTLVVNVASGAVVVFVAVGWEVVKAACGAAPV